MRPALEFAVVALSGGALGLAFLPAPTGWLAWFALVPLLVSAHERSPREALRLGWVFGAAAWLGGIAWLPRSLAVAVNAPLPVTFAAYALLCVYGGALYALAAAGLSWTGPRLARLWKMPPAAVQAAASVPFLLALEQHFPMPFPARLANTQTSHLAFLQSADIFGLAGIGALIAAANAALFWLVVSRGRRSSWVALGAVLLLGAANEGYGRRRIREIDSRVAAARRAGEFVRVAALQGGIPAAHRFATARFDENLAVYNALAKEAAKQKVDLMLWPENSYERLVDFPLRGTRAEADLSRDIAATGADALIGATGRTRDGGRKLFLALLLDASRRVLGVTGKQERTPFTEALPFEGLVPGLDRLVLPRVWLLRPAPRMLLRTSRGVVLGVYICYEALAERSARSLTRAGAELLVNPANNDDIVPALQSEQELRVTSLRAIENRRFVVRPSERSFVIDPVGRVARRLPAGERAWFAYEAPRLTLRSFYTRVGPLLYAAAALASLVLVAAAFAAPL